MMAMLQKPLAALAIAIAFALAAVFLTFCTVTIVRGMEARARASAISERDAHWTAEIAKSSTAEQARIAANLRQTMAADAAARDRIADAEARAAELETENAALASDGRCGVGRDRVRLLNQR